MHRHREPSRPRDMAQPPAPRYLHKLVTKDRWSEPGHLKDARCLVMNYVREEAEEEEELKKTRAPETKEEMKKREAERAEWFRMADDVKRITTEKLKRFEGKTVNYMKLHQMVIEKKEMDASKLKRVKAEKKDILQRLSTNLKHYEKMALGALREGEVVRRAFQLTPEDEPWLTEEELIELRDGVITMLRPRFVWDFVDTEETSKGTTEKNAEKLNRLNPSPRLPNTNASPEIAAVTRVPSPVPSVATTMDWESSAPSSPALTPSTKKSTTKTSPASLHPFSKTIPGTTISPAAEPALKPSKKRVAPSDNVIVIDDVSDVIVIDDDSDVMVVDNNVKAEVIVVSESASEVGSDSDDDKPLKITSQNNTSRASKRRLAVPSDNKDNAVASLPQPSPKPSTKPRSSPPTTLLRQSHGTKKRLVLFARRTHRRLLPAAPHVKLPPQPLAKPSPLIQPKSTKKPSSTLHNKRTSRKLSQTLRVATPPPLPTPIPTHPALQRNIHTLNMPKFRKDALMTPVEESIPRLSEPFQQTSTLPKSYYKTGKTTSRRQSRSPSPFSPF
ncbi:hypothetical protein BC829DRAFT_439982 [Chytridium lagenaria]|nr:hypothetical protein BC829DRAFT_439982 [Chytridium lagenaria]